MTTPAPIIRAAGEGDRQAFFGGGIHTWKFKAADTNGAFFLFETVMAKGKLTPLHLHPDADETTYVLEGEILAYVDGKENLLGAGAWSFVPRGTPHAILVVSDTCRMLSLKTPGIGEEFYLGASEPATDDTDDTFDTFDIARVQASARDNGGVEILGPPPFESANVG